MQKTQNNLLSLTASFCLCVSLASAQIGTITNVGKTTANLDAIAFNSSGTLYGGSSGAGSLYTIDPATGAVTLIHALVGVSNPSLAYGVTGLAFQPGTGVLYASTSPDSPNSGNSLVTINPANGQVTVIGASGTGRPYTDIAFAPNGTLYGWLIGSGALTISAATVNLSTGAGTSLGSPQTPAAVPDGGGLAVNSSGVIYVAANGHVGAPCSPTTNCTGVFWTINPASGAPTTIGTISGGPGSAPTITALAFSSAGILYGIEGGDGGASWNLVTIKAGSQPATPVGVSPSSGSSASQTLQFTFTDPRGVRDLDVVNILINNFLDGRNACYLAYSLTAQALYLVADDGSTLLPVNAPSAAANSQCSVSVSGNTSVSGNDLIGSLTFNFTPAFAGNKVIYMAARDLQGGNSGWQALGAWQVPGFSTFPSAVSIDQPRTSGSSQSLTFTFADTKGAQDLGIANVLVNDFLDGRNACYIAYSQTFHVLYLVGDNGGGLSAPLTPGGSGSVSNSQCTVNAPGSSASTSGNNLLLTLNISFKPAFNGNRIVYAAARDSTDANNSGWQALGTTTVQ